MNIESGETGQAHLSIRARLLDLCIDGKFENPAVDSEMLYAVCQLLQNYAKPVPTASSSFKLPDSWNPFAKK